MKLTLLIMAALTGAAGVFGVSFWRQSEPPRGERAWSYRPDHIAAKGITEGAHPEAALRMEARGRLARILVRENKVVARGDLLAELHNEREIHQVALAQAEVAQARASLDKVKNGERQEKRDAIRAIENAQKSRYDLAKAEFQRAEKLIARRAVSQSEWDNAYFRVLTSEAEWKQARAERVLIEAPARVEDVAAAEAAHAAAGARLQSAQAELAKTRLNAPAAGSVMQVFAEPGEMAGPDTSQPLLILADLTKRRVRAFVEEIDIGRVHAAQDAVITADGVPGKEFRGKVAAVLPRMGKRAPLSHEPGEYRDLYFREVLIDLDEALMLPTNLRVEARIDLNQGAKLDDDKVGDEYVR